MSTRAVTRVVVADDQALLRAGLSGIIRTAPDLAVVGEAGDGNEAVQVARDTAPDVVLMDVRMPALDGIAATRMVTSSLPGTRVLMLTTFDMDEYVYGALRAGASGFLLKDVPPADLIAAIRVVAAGEALLAPPVTRRLIERFVTSAAPEPSAQTAVHSQIAGITQRERDVLRLVAEGLSNAEIGARLHITPGTAKTHVGHLLAKLGARDRVQLVILALRSKV
ncbi:DNA-binding NarL/FixJ family response regulator [Catenulispora sp. GP43]|uniref:response regulator n=1 Tax=Catenulispora sp. GP43 TaxID=3156263 RepID=UPI003519D33C